MPLVMDVIESPYTSSDDPLGACTRPAKWRRKSSVESHLQLMFEEDYPMKFSNSKNYMRPTISSLVKRKHRKSRSYEKPMNAAHLTSRLRVKFHSCLPNCLDLEAFQQHEVISSSEDIASVVLESQDEDTPSSGTSDWSTDNSCQKFEDEIYTPFLYPQSNLILMTSDDHSDNLPNEEPCAGIVCSAHKNTNPIQAQLVEPGTGTVGHRAHEHPLDRLKATLRTLGLKMKMSTLSRLLSLAFKTGVEFVLQLLRK